MPRPDAKPAFSPLTALTALVKDATRVSLELFKVMVPIIVAVKIIKELGLIGYMAMPLSPLMALVGLPPDMGLVWATAMINNIYGGIIVYAALAADGPALSAAQSTVLSTMMLIAHNLLVEGRVTHKCGVGFWGQTLIRVLGALACGALMHLVFSAFGLFAEPAPLLFAAQPEDASPWRWALGEARNLASIFLIITGLMVMMRVLGQLGLLGLFERLLLPVLRLIGIGRSAATITVIGLVMGLSYGGGLILHEVRGGKLSRADVFSSISLMGLSHALIEDTLLMALIGASAWGTLGARLVFSLAAVALLSRLLAPRLIRGGALAKVF